MADYPSPIDQLLTLGKIKFQEEWPDYRALGLDDTHIPVLIELATDSELHALDANDPKTWGPVHAWQALGQLHAVAAIEPLLSLIESLQDYDWTHEELPGVFAQIGPVTVTPLTRHLLQVSGNQSARITVGNALAAVAKQYPEVRTECVAALTDVLRDYRDNDAEFNSFMICFLSDLQAVESLPVIREAFEANTVDTFLMGDLEDVEIDLGVRTERRTPATPELPMIPSGKEDRWSEDKAVGDYPPPAIPASKVALAKAKAKAKAKRKLAAQSRKKNKKKKK